MGQVVNTLNTGFSWGEGTEQRTLKHWGGEANSADGLKQLILSWEVTIIINTGHVASKGTYDHIVWVPGASEMGQVEGDIAIYGYFFNLWVH